MHQLKFHYAIFDMDGLMFDTERLFLDSVRRKGESIHKIFPEEQLLQFLGRNHKDNEALFIKLFGTELSIDDCFAEAMGAYHDYIEANGIPVKPGLYELLEFLKANGVKIALATSSDHSKADYYLAKAQVTDYFDVILCGNQITHSKPDPEIFLLAAKLLSCEDKSDCIILEDSRNGLLAASAADIPVIIVPDLKDPTLEFPGLAYARVPDLSAAIPLFLQNT